jgi:hypothetical protein
VASSHSTAASSLGCEQAPDARWATTAASVGCSLTTPDGVTGKSALPHIVFAIQGKMAAFCAQGTGNEAVLNSETHGCTPDHADRLPRYLT